MLGSTTWNHRFWYTYVLRSRKDDKNYIGFTGDLRKRYREHAEGKSFATAPRRPLSLVYYEACLSRTDAKRREEYLKTTGGRRFVAKRLKDYYRNSKLY
jgi:putative endonuclease